MEKRIEKIWDGFRAKVMNPACPPDQVREMRFAFYAGVQAMTSINFDVANRGRESPDAAARILAEVDVELAEFLAAVKKEHGITR